MRLSDRDIVGLAILKDLEAYRLRIERGETTGGSNDHTVRMCQAIVTDYTQFKGKARKEWVAQL